MRRTLDSITESAKCAAAFAAAGLTDAAGLILHGIVIGSANLLLNSANTQMIGITDYARNRDLPAVGSVAIQAITINNQPGKKPDTLDTRARVLLNNSAFGGGKYSLREVLVHELMHVAGWPGEQPGFFANIWGDTDLSHYDKYDEIMEACK